MPLRLVILLVRESLCLYLCISVRYLWTDCKCDNITAMQDTVVKLYRCVVDIKIKVKFENG